MAKAIKYIIIALVAFILIMLVMAKCGGKSKVQPVVPVVTPYVSAAPVTFTAAPAVKTGKASKPVMPAKKTGKSAAKAKGGEIKTSSELKKESAAMKSKPKSTEKVNMKDYKFSISADKSSFEVSKNGQVILTKSAGEKESFQLGAGEGDKSFPKAGTDLTGDGRPDVVLKTKSEKDSCSNVYSVFSVGDDMALEAEIRGLSDGIEFKDLDKDGIPEIIGHDCTFLDWWAALGKPPAPKIILRYIEGSGYVLADDLMRKDPPADEDMQVYADSLKNGSISRVWSYMLDLIYTGNGDTAWKFYDMVEWNSEWETQATDDDNSKGKGDKQEYLEAFKEHLSTSPYWGALKKLNNWEYSEMGM
jgi:hypothetical protein